MKTTIRVKNKIYLEEKVKDYAEQKLSKIDQYFRNSNDLEANVLFKEYDDSKAVEVTIPTKNIILRAEVKEETFYNAIDSVIDKVIADNPKAVEDFKGGKVKALQALFGACMKELRGAGDPSVIKELLEKKMNG